MEQQLHSLSNQIYHIKGKITDLEFYNLMQTLQLLHKSSGSAIDIPIQAEPSDMTTSSAPSRHSSRPTSDSSSSHFNCYCGDRLNCLC